MLALPDFFTFQTVVSNAKGVDEAGGKYQVINKAVLDNNLLDCEKLYE